MNREIKFRFWGHFGNYDENDNPVYEMIYGDSFAFEEYAPINELMREKEDFRVMQYINRKDRNGREIYEGDILIDNDENYYIVEWQNLETRYFLYDITGKYCYNIYDYSFDCLEVVGNIYENPGFYLDLKKLKKNLQIVKKGEQQWKELARNYEKEFNRLKEERRKLIEEMSNKQGEKQ